MRDGFSGDMRPRLRLMAKNVVQMGDGEGEALNLSDVD